MWCLGSTLIWPSDGKESGEWVAPTAAVRASWGKFFPRIFATMSAFCIHWSVLHCDDVSLILKYSLLELILGLSEKPGDRQPKPEQAPAPFASSPVLPNWAQLLSGNKSISLSCNLLSLMTGMSSHKNDFHVEDEFKLGNLLACTSFLSCANSHRFAGACRTVCLSVWIWFVMAMWSLRSSEWTLRNSKLISETSCACRFRDLSSPNVHMLLFIYSHATLNTAQYDFLELWVVWHVDRWVMDDMLSISLNITTSASIHIPRISLNMWVQWMENWKSKPLC